MESNRAFALHTIDGALNNCAERLSDLSSFGLCPKNLILITALTLGTTAKNLQSAFQNYGEGLSATATQRIAITDFPVDITARVQLATNNDIDPRYNKASQPTFVIDPGMEVCDQFSKILAELTTKLSTTATAETLLQVIDRLTKNIADIFDETQRTTLEMSLLQPLTTLLRANQFDPKDQRTKLQSLTPLYSALSEDEIMFLRQIANSHSALSGDAQLLLSQSSSSDLQQAA